MKPSADLLERARKARFHINCPEWPWPCPFRTCEKLERCLYILPLTEEEKQAKPLG